MGMTVRAQFSGLAPGTKPYAHAHDCAIEPSAQRVLFYLYATNLVELREELVGAGQNPGPIHYPDYLPKGEMQFHDPDGYCVMIAQSHNDTP